LGPIYNHFSLFKIILASQYFILLLGLDPIYNRLGLPPCHLLILFIHPINLWVGRLVGGNLCARGAPIPSLFITFSLLPYFILLLGLDPIGIFSFHFVAYWKLLMQHLILLEIRMRTPPKWFLCQEVCNLDFF